MPRKQSFAVSYCALKVDRMDSAPIGTICPLAFAPQASTDGMS